MLSKLIKKEFALSVHVTSLLFLGLSAMLLIPNYPYYVTFFYTSLGLFFTCLLGRENHDIDFMLLLPIRKRDLVTARFASTLLLEAVQLLLCIPFAILRQILLPEGNLAGMDANTAFFGLALIQLGIQNYTFFTRYYRDPQKVGSSFVISSVAAFLYIALAETCAHAVPFFRDVLDTPDPLHLPCKLLVLFLGMLAFALLTWFAYRKSITSFETRDC